MGLLFHSFHILWEHRCSFLKFYVLHICHVKKDELKTSVKKIKDLSVNLHCSDCLFPGPKGKDESNDIEMTIPGLDWGMEEVMQKDQKKVPQKKVPYAKPIPAQFQQVST